MISCTSPPELKLPPAPVTTTAFTSLACASARNRSRNSAYAANVSGFLRAGRSSVTVATLPSSLALHPKWVAVYARIGRSWSFISIVTAPRGPWPAPST